MMPPISPDNSQRVIRPPIALVEMGRQCARTDSTDELRHLVQNGVAACSSSLERFFHAR
jgi:hypothetical protein